MNYKLAKELKNAGFPYSDHTEIAQETVCMDNNEGGCLFVPTLEELISACGVGLISITNENSYSHSGGKSKEIKWNWSAIGIQEPYPKGGYRHGMGKTPKIAVARLWLALNKK